MAWHNDPGRNVGIARLRCYGCYWCDEIAREITIVGRFTPRDAGIAETDSLR